MRGQGKLIAVAAACAALVAAAPAGACTTPKERYTASLAFQNATYLFSGQSGASASRLLGALGNGDGAGTQTAVSDLAAGGSAYATALQQYLSVTLQPQCRRARRAH